MEPSELQRGGKEEEVTLLEIFLARVLAKEMSYLRGACGVRRWDGLSNKSVYERCVMKGRGSGVWCGVVEWVTRSTLRWFGHIERMGNEELVKRVYLSSVEGMNKRGKALVRWEGRMREYVSEKGVRGNGLEWARRECMDRERWRSVCRGHPLEGHFRRERGVGAID